MTTLEILSTPELYRQDAILFCSAALGYLVGALIVYGIVWLVRQFKGRQGRSLDGENYSAARLRIMREREAAGLPPIPEAAIVRLSASVEGASASFVQLRRTMQRFILAARRAARKGKRRDYLAGLPEKARRVLA